MKLLPLSEKIFTKKDKNRFCNKVVDRVKESRNPIMPTVVSWSGETSDGYFLIGMIGGAILVHWTEREYELKYALVEAKYVACTEYVKSIFESESTRDEQDFMKFVNNVSVLKQLAEDTKNVKFEDIMELLNWKFHERKVEIESSDSFSIS